MVHQQAEAVVYVASHPVARAAIVVQMAVSEVPAVRLLAVTAEVRPHVALSAAHPAAHVRLVVASVAVAAVAEAEDGNSLLMDNG